MFTKKAVSSASAGIWVLAPLGQVSAQGVTCPTDSASIAASLACSSTASSIASSWGLAHTSGPMAECPYCPCVVYYYESVCWSQFCPPDTSNIAYLSSYVSEYCTSGLPAGRPTAIGVGVTTSANAAGSTNTGTSAPSSTTASNTASTKAGAATPVYAGDISGTALTAVGVLAGIVGGLAIAL